MESEIKKELQIISFSSYKDWENWLELNHHISNGIWLKFYKKNSGVTTIVYKEALDIALCFGWIDGQLKPCDENSYLQKFTPRRPQSIWSKRNIEHITRLEKAGKMKPSGLKAVEAAKADGRWDKAYDSPSNMEIPEDLLNELKKDEKALAFFESLNKANKYAITWRLQTAKRLETRKKRLMLILEMLVKGEKFHN